MNLHNKAELILKYDLIYGYKKVKNNKCTNDKAEKVSGGHQAQGSALHRALSIIV